LKVYPFDFSAISFVIFYVTEYTCKNFS